MIDTYLNSLKHYLGDEICAKQPIEVTSSNFKHDLDEVLQRVDSDELAQKFKSWMGFENTTIESYKNKVLTFSFGQAICGIRFKGGDRNIPFVDVCVRNFPVNHHTNYDEIREVLLAEFSAFNPKHFRTYVCSSDLKTLPDHIYEEDLRIVGGVIHQLTNGMVDVSPEVSLKEIGGFDDYDAFAEDYKAYKSTSKFSDSLYFQSKEDFVLLSQEGLAKLIYFQDEVCGLIACEKEFYLGMEGYSFVQEFLIKKYRGKGLAKQAQRLFLEQLQSQKYTKQLELAEALFKKK